MSAPFSSLRSRTTAAFLLVALVPLLTLVFALDRTLARVESESAERRIGLALDAAKRRVDELTALARTRVRILALRDLPLANPRDESDLASPGELRHDLPILDLVEGGRIVASHHWPAGLGLAQTDVTFADNESLRLQVVEGGPGANRRLTVTARQTMAWRGRLLEVRGGYLLDDDFLASLATPLGMTLGLRNTRDGEWCAASAASLREWTPQPDLERGVVSLGGQAHRFGRGHLTADLVVYVAASQRELGAVSSGLRRLTLGIAAIAALVAMLGALVFSSWITGPVRRLAAALPVVGRGERPQPLPEKGAVEVLSLSRAFNEMTSRLEESRERLLQAERVAAWREMARRLAHELKNPIFPIQVSIETLERVAARDPELGGTEFGKLFREATTTILDELRLLRGIIDEFSRFARLPRPTMIAMDVSAVARKAVALHSPRAGGVELDLRLEESLPAVFADPDLVGLALGNLVANAFEAMPDGGTLRVVTSAAGASVRIEVADTGPGMQEEQRSRLFTPYFTTKPGGTGLGLSIAQSVVADHGGRIDVLSSPGAGTRFILTLPAGRPAAVGEAP